MGTPWRKLSVCVCDCVCRRIPCRPRRKKEQLRRPFDGTRTAHARPSRRRGRRSRAAHTAERRSAGASPRPLRSRGRSFARRSVVGAERCQQTERRPHEILITSALRRMNEWISARRGVAPGPVRQITDKPSRTLAWLTHGHCGWPCVRLLIDRYAWITRNKTVGSFIQH